MDLFPRDVQTIILGLVAQNNPAMLLHLFRTNRMFRSWVTRFVPDFCFPIARINHYIEPSLKFVTKEELMQWNVALQFKKQWKDQPTFLTSFCIFVCMIPHGCHYVSIEKRRTYVGVNMAKGRDLFCKNNPLLKDLKLLDKRRCEVAVCKREIEKHRDLVSRYQQDLSRSQDRLSKNLAKREPLEEELEKLESKMKKNKV